LLRGEDEGSGAARGAGLGVSAGREQRVDAVVGVEKGSDHEGRVASEGTGVHVGAQLHERGKKGPRVGGDRIV
jgi:hypothetical protein